MCRKVNDLSLRTQLVESKEQLRAATQASTTTRDVIRVFRGSEPAEEVEFTRQ